MSLFDYLKWRYEQKQKSDNIKKIEKLESEIEDLIAKAEGFEIKAEVYRINNGSLMCSNYMEQACLLEKAHILRKKIKSFQRVLDRLLQSHYEESSDSSGE